MVKYCRQIVEGTLCMPNGTLTHGQVHIGDNGLIEKIDYVCKLRADHSYESHVLIFPGLGDIHVHLREDQTGELKYKEDYDSGSRAAVNGGVTFVADMPNTKLPATTQQRYVEKELLTKNSHVPVILYAGIGPKNQWSGPCLTNYILAQSLKEVQVLISQSWTSLELKMPKLHLSVMQD